MFIAIILKNVFFSQLYVAYPFWRLSLEEKLLSEDKCFICPQTQGQILYLSSNFLLAVLKTSFSCPQEDRNWGTIKI